jgi:cell division ATPase FtsA
MSEILSSKKSEKNLNYNMNFKKQELSVKTFSLLDIWTYKIRTVTCKFFDDGIGIIGYNEKRQEEDSFFLWEAKDIQSICDNVKCSLEKSEKEKIGEEIIVNLFAPQFFLYSNQINFSRKNENEEINEKEIISLLKDFEKKYISSSCESIKNKSGYNKEDLKLIFSSIGEMKIDGKKIDFPIGKKGKNIKIGIINIFMPLPFFDVTKKILSSLGRENFKIIPFEYSVLRTIPEENVVVVNIGNTKTYIGIKRDNYIVWTTRINIGIGDLIKKIREKYNLPQIEIIKNLDTHYKEEREEFLDIMEKCIVSGIEEIVENDICPHLFLLIWWWAHNIFVKIFFETLNLRKYGIKIMRNVQLVNIEEEQVIEDGEFLKNPSNFDIFSTILTYSYLEERRNDFLTKNLEKVIKEIEEET